MTAKEFSDQFDVLYNNITSNQAPGLNEKKKSVFLTKAQDEIVKNYFLAEANPKGKGFDDTHKRQMDFSMLMTVATPESSSSEAKIDPRSKMYLWPTNVLYIINEFFNVGSTSAVKPRQILALSYGEYTRLMSKPYKAPLKYQAWRLITGQESGKTRVEIILNAPDLSYLTNNSGSGSYEIRYVRKPKAIVLADFTNAYGEQLSIDGVTGANDSNTIVLNGKKIEATEVDDNTIYSIVNDPNGVIQYIVPTTYDAVHPCELHESIHWEILQRAVELAKIAWAGDQEQIAAVNMATTAGQRSE